MGRSTRKPKGPGAVVRGAEPDEAPGGDLGRRVAWVIAVFLWAFVVLSLVSFDPSDPPGHAVAPANVGSEVSNLMGPVGAHLAHHVSSALGIGVWVMLAGIGAWLAQIAWRGPVDQLLLRIVGIVLLSLSISGFHALLLPAWSRFPEGGGGLLAIFAATELSSRFGTVGAGLWLALLGLLGIAVAFDNVLVLVPRMLARGTSSGGAMAARAGGALGRAIRERTSVRLNDLDDDARIRVDPSEAALEDDAQPRRKRKKKTRRKRDIEAHPVMVSGDVGEESDEQDDSAAPQEFNEEELRAKIAKLPVRFAGSTTTIASEEDLLEIRARNMHTEADQTYVFPDLDLLEDPEASYSDELSAYVREQAETLELALREYGIDGEVAGIDSGPVITLYQVRLAPGTKVSTVTSVASDLARALKAVNLRIVPNTEGLDTVGIEVPNRKKEKVRLKELMSTSDATSRMSLPLFLGKDASGEPLIQDLASMPHLLMAGTTGSGKSVCMSAVIMGFLYTQKPSDLKLVLIDPKMVELSQFKKIPHLMCPVVTDMAKAAAILEWAVAKMDERYELLVEAGCRDITAYNALSWEELRDRFAPSNESEEAAIPRKLPYMVFVIDELADMMITNREVEGSIVRMAQKARAVGIHLVVATQRPQANVVTGLIKSNMPGRISFKVASGMDSRIVLDQKGGELLLGQGDMLMITPRSATPIRAQGTLVDDDEIRRVTRFIREISEPSYERQLMQLRSSGEHDQPWEDHEQRMVENAQQDPLFDRAVEIVLETKRGSVSLLQRRLAIGYTRASRLVELMGMAGILGSHKGSVAREVMISLDEWEAMKDQAARDAEERRNLPSSSGATMQMGGAATDNEEEEIQRARATGEVADDEEAGAEDAAAQAEAEGGEFEYEYEYEYVDEDGNPIEGEIDDESEYEYVDEFEDEEKGDERDEPESETDPTIKIRAKPLDSSKGRLGKTG